jgi:hypothetical protein
MKKFVFLFFGFLLISGILSAQGFADPKLPNYHPASPSAFQFLKYDEMPVSEYTGIPNISIPLYEIQEGGVSVPVSLTYHAGGIRVSQEASWVGLGWDLNVNGTIVQEINDLDDYGVAYTRLRPDYNESPIPTLQITKYQLGCATITNPGWTNPIAVQSPKPFYAYNVYTAYYMPVNGDRDNPILGNDLSNSLYYDSEPDIFTATFLGHSIKFIRNFQNSQIIVLNKKGYSINRNGDIYTITVPSGDQFFFEINATVNSYSATTGGLGGTSSSQTSPSSKMWMLTKIITKNKKQILFNYAVSSIVNNYPSYSEKWDTAINPVSQYYYAGNAPEISAYSSQPLYGTARTISYSTENKFSLNSITFPKGQIDFITSDRNDLPGGKKLDAVQIKGSNQIVNSFQFNYSYFDGSGVGGGKFTPDNESSYGNTNNLRLKLLSLQDNSGALHTFTYDPTVLPPKNSLAQDFWGFYNGQLSNTSIIPNPARLSVTQMGTSSAIALPDNGNNNSARLSYTKAGVLTNIKYPTGGKINLEYELNQFDNYILPDYSTTANTVTNGNGLRLYALNYQAVDNSNAKRTIYSYVGGKAQTPLQVGRSYNISSFQIYPMTPNSQPGSLTNYQMIEISGRGFYSTNSLGSGNSVGYDKVIKQIVDGNGISLGKTETTYNNTPDDISNSANSFSQLSASLPSKKHISAPGLPGTELPENGTPKVTMIYDNQNKLLKKAENTYNTFLSDISYGARFFGYGSMFYPTNCAPTTSAYFASVPYTMVGHYPIYDIRSLLASTVTTEYDENNNNIVSTTYYSYDAADQLSAQTINKSQISGQNGQVISRYTYPDYFSAVPGSQALFLANRFNEIINTKMTLVKGPTGQSPQFIDYNQVDHEFITIGDKIVKNKTIITLNPGSNAQTQLITYNKYDAGNANLLEYTEKGTTNSLLWDYNGNYLIAEVKNAAYDDVSYSSFEGTYTGNAGNWVLVNNSTTPDITAPTGKNCYLISPANTLSKPGLSAAKSYIVSYWSKSGSYTVTGSITTLTGKTLNGWTYYEHQVINTATVSISGSGYIDEVRLYPKAAQMSTYTYLPLTGLQSQCDVRSTILYYEYDPYSRLSVIRDEKRNVLKKICYNYAGQTENCTTCTNFTPNWQNTATALRCQQGSSGNTGYQEQEQKDMNVCSPTYNQTKWVSAGYNATACPASVMVPLTSTNVQGIAGYTASYYNTVTGVTYTFNVPTATGLQPLGNIPEGTYNLTIDMPGGSIYGGDYWSGCKFQTISGNTPVVFYNITVSATGCKSIKLDLPA